LFDLLMIINLLPAAETEDIPTQKNVKIAITKRRTHFLIDFPPLFYTIYKTQ
jgi:hypothetical protein